MRAISALHRRFFALVALAATISVGGMARAEDATSEHAKRLFSQAIEQIDRGHCDVAVGILHAVLDLDKRSIGAHVNLADCYERMGKPVTAWHYARAGTMLAASQSDARLSGMREKEAALEAKLPRLGVDNATHGLSVRVNGAVVPRERWNGPLLEDAGRKEIVVAAPGYKTRTMSVTITDDGMPARVEVPALEPDAERGRAQRVGGLVLVGVGAAAFLGAGVTYFLAASAKADATSAREACNASAPPNGVCVAMEDEKSKAGGLGDVATVLDVVGGGLLLVGAIVYFTAPTKTSAERTVTARRPLELSVRPTAARQAVGMALGASW